MKRTVKRAFTLIELMVVIAIIGVLVALLMPAVNTALAKGKEASCLSNLHQHGVALIGYGSANRGHVLEWGTTNASQWMGVIEPYLSAGSRGSVRLCPVAKQPVATSGSHGSAHTAWRITGNLGVVFEGSYAVNSHVTAINSVTNNSFRRLTDTDSSVPAFTDGAWWETGAIANAVVWPISLEQGSDWILDRHRKAVCMAYADGHGARVELAMIFDQQWGPQYTRKGRQTWAPLGIK